MFGSNAVNLFSQASKQNKIQTPVDNANQAKPVEDKAGSGNKQTLDVPAQKEKISNERSNPFLMNKDTSSQPKPNIFTENKGSNIFTNPITKNNLFFNNQATGLQGKSESSNNLQKSNLFSSSTSPPFGSKLSPNQFTIFEAKTNEINSKKDQDLTKKTDVAGKQNQFSLASTSNQFNGTTQQKTNFGTQKKNLFDLKPSSQTNSLFGAKNQSQKLNIFSAEQSKAPNTLFGPTSVTPGFLNLNKPEKQPQTQKKEEPKVLKNEQLLPFKLFNKQSQQKKTSKPIIPLIPQPSKQKDEPLQQLIKSQNTPPALTEKKQQILSILNQIQKERENIELESKLQRFTQSELHHAQSMKENSQQQKRQLSQKLQKANELLKQKKEQVQKLKILYQDQNCFKSIANRFTSQSIDKVEDEENAINTQMANLVRQVKQYYQKQSQNVNPEIQLRNIFKNIKKQRQNQHNLTFKQEQLNKQSIQTLKNAGRVKPTKQCVKQPLGKQKQSFMSKSRQSIENNDEQINYLRKLQAENKVQINKLMKARESQAIQKKVISKISQGRTSMIMKSIIME